MVRVPLRNELVSAIGCGNPLEPVIQGRDSKAAVFEQRPFVAESGLECADMAKLSNRNWFTPGGS